MLNRCVNCRRWLIFWRVCRRCLERAYGPLLLVLALVASCGSVTTSELTTDAGDAGGRGGELGQAGTTGAGGRGGDQNGGGGASGTTGAGGGGGELGQGGTGAGGAACVAQVDANAAGFSVGTGCNGEPPATASACHARCTINGAPFVGCVENTPYARYCFGSCADCP